MRREPRTVICALAALTAATVSAEIREVACMYAAPVSAPPLIDGALDDAAWKNAIANTNYYRYWTDDPEPMPEQGTVSMVVYDEKGIYVGVRNPEHLMSKLRTNIRNDNDINIWTDDCAEIHFDPAAKAEGYYKFTVNALGRLATSWRMDVGNFHDDWLSPGARAAGKIYKDRWELELFVPWRDIKVAARPQAGTVWLFSHNRFRFTGGGRHTTTSPGGTYQKIDYFTYLFFTDGTPPAAGQVLDEVVRRAKPLWGMKLAGRNYFCDEKGLRTCADDVPTLRRKDAAAKKAREEKAKTDLARLLSGEGAVRPMTLALAGTYDFRRPAEYDGFNGFYRHNPDVAACIAERHPWKTDGAFRPKTLFMTRFCHQLRDAVETAARFPLVADYFPGNFGAGGPYEIGVSLGDALSKARQFESLLARNPDVVVVDDFHCASIPLAYRVELLRRVRDEGMGIVLLTHGHYFNDVFAKARKIDPVKAGERVCRFGKGILIAASPLARCGAWTPNWRSLYERRQVYVWNLIRRARGLPPDTRLEAESERLVAAESDFGGLSVAGGNVVPEGGTLPVEVRFAKPAATDGTLDVKVTSMPYGDLWRTYRVPVAAGAERAAFTLGDGEFPTLAGLAEITLVEAGGRVAARLRKPFHYPNHRFEDYTLISWDGVGYGCLSGAASAFLAPKLVEEFGYRNALGAVDGGCTYFNSRPVPYRCRVNLLKAKNGGVRWPQIAGFARQNPACRAAAEKLGDEVNPYDPAVRELIEDYFTREVERVVPYGVSVWDLGDECAVVYDAGHGPKDRKPFADFLRRKYGSIEAFNRIRSLACRSFDEAPHLTVQEALKRKDHAAWLDHIEYMDRMYADSFQIFADIIRRYDPRARIGAEGSDPGDLELTVKNLDFWGPYRNLVSDETLRNVRPDAMRGIWWGGYIQSMRSGFPLEQWEYILTGTINADLWFQMEPGVTLSAFSGDLNFAPYVERMLPHLKKLRRGIAQTLIHTPFRNDGFACYRSQLSLRAGQVGAGFRPPDMSIGAVIRHCYRTGRDIRIVTTGTREKLRDVKTLLLCGTTALTEPEIADLKAFAARGGLLLADTEPGVLTRYLTPRAEPPLKGLWRPMPEADDFDAFEKGLLAAGIAPNPEQLTGLDPDETVFRVREAPGLRIVGFKTSVNGLGRKVSLSLGRPGYVYEPDGAPVGRTDRIDIASLDVPFKVYAVFDDAPSAPAFTWRNGKVTTDALRRGGVYRLSLIAPDGSRPAHREDVFRATGEPVKAERALSDAPGVWRVELLDVASGLSSSRPMAD